MKETTEFNLYIKYRKAFSELKDCIKHFEEIDFIDNPSKLVDIANVVNDYLDFINNKNTMSDEVLVAYYQFSKRD